MQWLNVPNGTDAELQNQCKTRNPSCYDKEICSTYSSCTLCDRTCGIKFCSSKAYCDGYLCGILID
jgi:hypothetical protein